MGFKFTVTVWKTIKLQVTRVNVQVDNLLRAGRWSSWLPEWSERCLLISDR